MGEGEALSEGGEELVDLEGLLQLLADSGPPELAFLVPVEVRGHRDDGRPLAREGFGELDPIDVRQDEVEKNQVELLILADAERLATRPGRRHPMPGRLEQLPDELEAVFGVLDHEEFHRPADLGFGGADFHVNASTQRAVKGVFSITMGSQMRSSSHISS